MPTALESLNIGEVSGVDHPAHLEEGWMVLKAAGASDDAIAKVEIVEALVDAVEKAATLGVDLLNQVGTDVLDDRQRAVIKALGTTDEATKEATDMPDFDKSTLDPEALAYVESVEKARDAALAAVTTTEDPEATALAKAMEGLPEPIRKHLETQAAEVRKAREDAERERNIRLDAEYLQKARGYKNLSVNPNELAPTLRKLADLDAHLYVEVERMLKAADEQLGTSDLFKSIGSARPVEGSATERLESFAKAKVADGTASDFATALEAAATEHPDLYAQYRAEAITGSQEG